MAVVANVYISASKWVSRRTLGGMRVSVLDGVEPVAFWQRFEELTTIARPSRHEEPVIAWVKDWAAERGFALSQDAGRNLVIRVRARDFPSE